ncbi:hypothetical protein V5O48_011362 [Marasmius crinis-equi]|uniref:Uncharacterized protein n=1 Tax=Marasmius crinis-equi TaxID=585013 RepID=A0ABR3F649_9AGAR
MASESRSSPRKPVPSRLRGLPQPRKRGPRRCKKCPGPNFPLQTECLVHSQRANARASAAARATTVDATLPGGPQEDNKDNMRLNGPILAPSPSRMATPSPGPQLPVTPSPHRESPPPPSQSQMAQSAQHLLSPEMPHSSPPIEDASRRDTTPSPSSMAPQIRRQNRLSRTVVDGTRVRPTHRDPTHGFMVAKRGANDYKVVRPGRLLGRMTSGKVTQRYNTWIDRILISCERAYDETGLWINLAAQHPGARGEHIHWTSPTLERDTHPTIFQHLNEVTDSIYSCLKTARRQDIHEVEFKSARYRQQRDEAQKRVDEQEEILGHIGEYLRSQGKTVTDVLAELRAQHDVPPLHDPALLQF